MKILTLRISEPLEKRLEQMAQKKGVTKSILVREALENYFTKPNTIQKDSFLAQAEDLAGTVEGPFDLSTNKAYLKGYGQ